MTLLSTNKLSCYFGGLKAVDQVDFDLQSGEIRAIIGPNGAGKSTFVSMLCGRQRPTAGRVMFKGIDITNRPAHKRTAMGMAYTFQITSIFKELSCSDNVSLAAQSTLMRSGASAPGGKKLLSAAHDALVRVGLEDQAAVKAGSMSYGHQRLLEVAMGLALEPELLMLDEPTQGLADSEIENFVALVRAVAKDATILLIEHNMDVVMQLADTITVFNEGQILATGTPDTIQNDPAVQRAYLGA